MNEECDSNAFELDWDTQALWVQDRLMYVLEGDDPLAEVLTVVDQRGQRTAVERARLEASHIPVRNRTVYKPRFRPVQAFCPRETIQVDIEGASVEVVAGDALIRAADGTVSVLPRHDFNCRYQFVAAAGSEPPPL